MQRAEGFYEKMLMAKALRSFLTAQWLCVLENSTIAIKNELLPLCAIVLPTLKIEWNLIEQWLKLLTDEILTRVTPSQKLIVLPYLQEMQQIFFEERKYLSVTK
jgi:hypothetical protein